jgi:hypothetical protein
VVVLSGRLLRLDTHDRIQAKEQRSSVVSVLVAWKA